MYLRDEDNNSQTYARLYSLDWGIWGKEKYTLDEECQNTKHILEYALIQKLIIEIPERLKLALRYSYGICDLGALSSPISEKEFANLSEVYYAALEYSCHLPEGLSELITELYCIYKTAGEIPGFTDGQIVNESSNPEIWRKYIYLDFFKFSLINILIREPISEIIQYSGEQLTTKLILSYFVGVGSFVEKVSALFPDDYYQSLISKVELLCNKIEIYPEFPDIQYQNFQHEYNELLNIITVNRRITKSESNTKRYIPFDICNLYYQNYIYSDYAQNYYCDELLLDLNKPLKALTKFYAYVKKLESLNTTKLLYVLRTIRACVEKKYFDNCLLEIELNISTFYKITTHPFFQALIYEGKILSLLFRADHPDLGEYYSSLFIELVPFYALSFKKRGKLFQFDVKVPNNLPRLMLVHHVHNADCEKLYDKMVINKLLIWDSQKVFFNISSSSSKVDLVLKEREYCLELGYNHYRIHARQHLKAGNQNRAIPNLIDGVGKEYYLTLDDDYFVFPDFALIGHERMTSKNMDYIQAPLSFRGIYDYVTFGEKVDAESMLFFESTYGRNYPRNYVFPRGTGTIFNFSDGKNSLSDTGGFLVDFSCEDFGQGYISLIQQNSNIYGKIKSDNTQGHITDKIFIIGEGVDLNGKLKQIERWMQGSSTIFFHLLIPAMFKSIIKGETKLVLNKQFISTFCLTAMGITFKFMLLLFFCLPLLYSTSANSNIFMPQIIHVKIIICVILANFLSLFSMYFYVFGKVSFTAALRLVLIEPLITLPSIVGYLKGIIGEVPKVWQADKSRKSKHYSYLGVYFLIMINLFPIVMNVNHEFWLHFWAIFNLLLIIFGVVIFNRYSIPKDILIKSNIKINLTICLFLFTISIVLNVWFFISEFETPMNSLKKLLLWIMVFNFYMSFRMMILNLILIYKQNKYIPGNII
jgi:hypothetical protein